MHAVHQRQPQTHCRAVAQVLCGGVRVGGYERKGLRQRKRAVVPGRKRAVALPVQAYKWGPHTRTHACTHTYTWTGAHAAPTCGAVDVMATTTRLARCHCNGGKVGGRWQGATWGGGRTHVRRYTPAIGNKVLKAPFPSLSLGVTCVLPSHHLGCTPPPHRHPNAPPSCPSPSPKPTPYASPSPTRMAASSCGSMFLCAPHSRLSSTNTEQRAAPGGHTAAAAAADGGAEGVAVCVQQRLDSTGVRPGPMRGSHGPAHSSTTHPFARLLTRLVPRLSATATMVPLLLPRLPPTPAAPSCRPSCRAPPAAP